MSPSATRRYSGIALIVVLASVAIFMFRHIRHEEAATETGNQVVLVSPNPKVKALGATSRFSIDVVRQGLPTTISATSPTDVPVDASMPTTVLGWAIDSANQTLPSKIFIVVDGTTWIQANIGEPRPDVAKVLLNPSLANCGFRGVVPAGILSAGRHSLAIAIVNQSGNGFYSGYSLATIVAG